MCLYTSFGKQVIERTVEDIGNMKENMKPTELYRELKFDFYGMRPYQKEDLGEEMTLVNKLNNSYWKPRYLIDHKAGMAYEFMDDKCRLLTVTADDIAWETLDGLSELQKEHARNLDGYFPTLIYSYQEGVAEVKWEINPDGCYFMDEDGFGGTDDVEVALYGFIDRKGRPLTKFRIIQDSNELKAMKQEAKLKMNEQQ